MAKQNLIPPGMTGPEGVIIAVIARAVDDVMGDGGYLEACDAWAYFGGPTYQHHVTSLGLPAGRLPDVLNETDSLLDATELLLRGAT